VNTGNVLFPLRREFERRSAILFALWQINLQAVFRSPQQTAGKLRHAHFKETQQSAL